MNGGLRFKSHSFSQVLAFDLKTHLRKRMEAKEVELIVKEPLGGGDQGLEEGDLHGGVRGGVLALRQQGPQAWYRGQPVL